MNTNKKNLLIVVKILFTLKECKICWVVIINNKPSVTLSNVPKLWKLKFKS